LSRWPTVLLEREGVKKFLCTASLISSVPSLHLALFMALTNLFTSVIPTNTSKGEIALHIYYYYYYIYVYIYIYIYTYAYIHTHRVISCVSGKTLLEGGYLRPFPISAAAPPQAVSTRGRCPGRAVCVRVCVGVCVCVHTHTRVYVCGCGVPCVRQASPPQVRVRV
jgi:hypothetical protein